MPRRSALLVMVLGGTAALAACAAPAPTPTVAPAKPAAPPTESVERTAPTPVPTAPPQPVATAIAKPSPAPSPAPKPTQAPAKPQAAKVTIAQPATGLSFAPLNIAQGKKFFAEEAIEADFQVMQNDSLVIASLVSGESQFGITGSNQQFAAHEKGLGFITVAAFASAVLLEIAARAEFLRQKGATPQQPLKDKVAALKGAKIGVPSLSGTLFQYGTYALKTNGLDPEANVDFIAIPAGAPRITSLRDGQVDAFLGGIPDPEIIEFEGVGSVFINLGEEVPAFKNIAYQAFYGRKDWIEQNANVSERVCRAIARANNLIRNDPPAAKEAVRNAFPQINPQILDVSMDRVKTAFAADARMTEEMWKNAADVFVTVGAIKAVPPLAEGTLWTNKYLTNVPKR